MKSIVHPLFLISGCILFLWTGCNKDVPELSVDQHELNFTSTCVGGICQKSVYVENTGSSDLVITAIFFEGPHKSDFSYTMARQTLAVGEKGSITVKFSPLGIGERNAQMVISSNDKNDPEFSISVLGSGLPKSGSWKGDNIQFNISEDGQNLTETGSVIDEGASLIVAASGYACGGYTTLTCYYYSDIQIENNAFNYSDSEDEIKGTFFENNTCEVTGSLGYTSYFTSCSFTLNLGKLVAEPAGLKSVAPENNVKGRIEYYDDGRIKRIVTIMKDPNKP